MEVLFVSLIVVTICLVIVAVIAIRKTTQIEDFAKCLALATAIIECLEDYIVNNCDEECCQYCVNVNNCDKNFRDMSCCRLAVRKMVNKKAIENLRGTK